MAVFKTDGSKLDDKIQDGEQDRVTSVDHFSKTGYIAQCDEKEFDTNLVFDFCREECLLTVTGSTYAIKAEIKSLKDDANVESVMWEGSSKGWRITLRSDAEMHSAVANLTSYLKALVIVRRKKIANQRRESLVEARRARRDNLDAKREVIEANKAGQVTRKERFDALQKWRAEHASSFKDFFYASGQWYNVDDFEKSTCCPYCRCDALNYYGSEEHPFVGKPTKVFLEYCPHCEHHFFNNWN